MCHVRDIIIEKYLHYLKPVSNTKGEKKERTLKSVFRIAKD